MKKYLYIHTKYFPIMLLLFFSIGIPIEAQITGEFPYSESFLSETKPVGIETPEPANTDFKNGVSFTKDGVMLTPAEFGKFGAFYLNNHQFTASAGIFISFEYMAYGGGASGGDGLSVFFFDADEDNPGIGAPGAGIGYAYNRSIIESATNKFRNPGVRRGYLGIALDSYGNYKGLRYQGESRVNGLPFGYATTGTSDLRENTSSDVTLRGAMSPTAAGTAPGLGVGFAGYPVLVTQSTIKNLGYIMRTGTPNYAWAPYDQLKAKQPFTIRGNTEFERPTDPGYRRAYIELFPNNENGGFFVSVMIQNENSKDTVIYDYEYRESLTYLENAYYNNTGDNWTGNQPVFSSPSKTLVATVPPALKIGFAAATGSGGVNPQRDNHVIKNLKVILPRAAEAYDDYEEDKFQGTPVVTFKPLLNDIGYKGPIERVQDPCPTCIDGTTFRFIDEDGNQIYDDNQNIIEHEVDNVGKWTYDKTTETVRFEPLRSFIGEARIQYNVKGGKEDPVPYADEPYRSTAATIGVNIVVSPIPPKMISNKMVTSKFAQ